MTTISAFELNVNFAPIGKGTNGGRATLENKIDDGISAVDNAANAAKIIAGDTKKQTDESKTVKDTLQVLHYGGTDNTLQKTEKSVNGQIVKIEKNN
ncbi:hypothetical protein [Flavobacterium sp. N1736]|uniref:hypothetical protein n=1 Tax=Flavobacterium sp. N1736 TaxID=2986823 RepID=UPI0022247D26|nr:hypothetical protein [Flavobacterium sp. N1736]